MKKFILTGVLIAFGLFSCSNIDENENKSFEKQKIKDLFQTWVKEFSESEDPNSYFKFVTDDFILSEPNSIDITSRDSLKSRVKNILANYRVRLKDWKSIDIIIRNDIAIHRHSGVLVLMPKTDSTEIDISLKYLDILKKNENGEWRVYIHSNMPDK